MLLMNKNKKKQITNITQIESRLNNQLKKYFSELIECFGWSSQRVLALIPISQLNTQIIQIQFDICDQLTWFHLFICENTNFMRQIPRYDDAISRFRPLSSTKWRNLFFRTLMMINFVSKKEKKIYQLILNFLNQSRYASLGLCIILTWFINANTKQFGYLKQFLNLIREVSGYVFVS